MGVKELDNMQLPFLENALVQQKLQVLSPLMFLALWLGWRVWKFTFLHLIYPN